MVCAGEHAQIHTQVHVSTPPSSIGPHCLSLSLSRADPPSMPHMKYASGTSRASRALLDGCEECELFARQCAVPFTSYELSATVMSISLSRGCIVICSGPSEAPSAVSYPRARSLGTDTISRDLPEESLVCVKTKHPPPPVPAIAPPLSSRIPQRAPFPWANDRPAAIESPPSPPVSTPTASGTSPSASSKKAKLMAERG